MDDEINGAHIGEMSNMFYTGMNNLMLFLEMCPDEILREAMNNVMRKREYWDPEYESEKETEPVLLIETKKEEEL